MLTANGTLSQTDAVLLDEWLDELASRPSPAPAVEEAAGFVVWDEKYGLAFQGRLYESREKAEKVLAGIVWHSRERYAVRRALLTQTGEEA